MLICPLLFDFDILAQFPRTGKTPQNPRRVSGGDGEIRDIRRYDGTGADHGMAADANATDNRRIAADASALAYKSAQTSHLAVGGRIEIIGKHDPVSDEYAVLKFDTVAY